MKNQYLILLMCAGIAHTGIMLGAQGWVSIVMKSHVEHTQPALLFKEKKLTLEKIDVDVKQRLESRTRHCNNKILLDSQEAKILKTQAINAQIPVSEIENAYAYLLFLVTCERHWADEYHPRKVAAAVTQAEVFINEIRTKEPKVAQDLENKARSLELIGPNPRMVDRLSQNIVDGTLTFELVDSGLEGNPKDASVKAFYKEYAPRIFHHAEDVLKVVEIKALLNAFAGLDFIERCGVAESDDLTRADSLSLKLQDALTNLERTENLETKATALLIQLKRDKRELAKMLMQDVDSLCDSVKGELTAAEAKRLVAYQKLRSALEKHKEKKAPATPKSDEVKNKESRRTSTMRKQIFRWVGGGITLAACAAAVWYFGFHKKKTSPQPKKTA